MSQQDQSYLRAPVSTECPRRCRGVAATCLHGIFPQACCTELWCLEAGKLDCRAGVFDELFAAYASGVLGSGGVGAAATASTGAASRARALDTASKGRKGPKAGAASNRTAML